MGQWVEQFYNQKVGGSQTQLFNMSSLQSVGNDGNYLLVFHIRL